jgi:hypothetical protein
MAPVAPHFEQRRMRQQTYTTSSFLPDHRSIACSRFQSSAEYRKRAEAQIVAIPAAGLFSLAI